VGGVRAPCDRQDRSRSDHLGEGGEPGVGQQAAGRRVAADDPHRHPRHGRIAKVGQAGVPVAVLGQDRQGGSHVHPEQALGLRANVTGIPGRVVGGDDADRLVQVVVCPLDGILGHRRHRGERHRRRIEEDEACRTEPGGRQGGGGHGTPAVADHPQPGRGIPGITLAAGQPGRAGEGRDIRSVVPEAMVSRPVARQPVTGLVDRDRAPARRSERGAQPPEPGSRRRHPVEEQQRATDRVAPGEPCPRDPCRVGRAALRRRRRLGGERDGGREVGRRRADRVGERGMEHGMQR
jgi:hypothetical protein